MVALASDTCQEKIPRDRSGAGNDTIIDGIGIQGGPLTIAKFVYIVQFTSLGEFYMNV